MEYLVTFSNRTVDFNTGSILDDKVDSISKVAQGSEYGLTTLGGMALALSSKFDSTAHMRFTGAAGYEITSSGSPPNEYVV